MGTFYHAQPLRAIVRVRQFLLVLAVLFAALSIAPARVHAQTPDSSPDSLAPVTGLSPHYWRTMALGVGASILAHESGHILTSIALGKHPTFGFDKLRPTVYSGIFIEKDPRAQFYFSAAGLTVQSVIDEAILDIPHVRGNAFERGVLGGGIGTTIFYLTIGRNGSVSDVEYMARTHVMNKTEVTAIFGSIAASHIIRMSRDSHYANFFARPVLNGRFQVGMSMGPF